LISGPLLALLGAIFGSFIATLSQRWGEGRSIMGRSACDACGVTLRPLNLIPLISWIAQRGRCTECGATIGWRQPAIELLAALLGAFPGWIAEGWTALLLAVFGWQLLALALMDLEHWRLPRPMAITLGASGLGVAFVGMTITPSDALIGGGAGWAGLAMVGAVYQRIRRRQGLGGGDPMMLGAIGCWLGWQSLPLLLLLASVAGLCWAMLLHGRGRAITAQTALPFGVFMAGAAFPLMVGRLTGWL
jgi:leader peptidase (prepilin peptidase)/N-methyltransferase